jgi:hypothetical protein
MDRRDFLIATAATLAAAHPSAEHQVASTTPSPQSPAKARFRTGLVAYSYRQALQSKAMTYED